ADEHAITLGDDRVGVAGRVRDEPLRPYGEPLGVDVSVEELVRVRAAVVAPPAVGMKPGDGLDIAGGGLSKPHSPGGLAARGDWYLYCAVGAGVRIVVGLPPRSGDHPRRESLGRCRKCSCKSSKVVCQAATVSAVRWTTGRRNCDRGPRGSSDRPQA